VQDLLHLRLVDLCKTYYSPRLESNKEEGVVVDAHRLQHRHRPAEREFFIDNLLVQIYFIIVMIRWTGLASEVSWSMPNACSIATALYEDGSYARLIDLCETYYI